MEKLRVIFMGTADLARPTLAALAESALCQIAAVVTQPDRPKGRALKLQPSAVKSENQKWGFPLLQPQRARHEEFIRTLAGHTPDLIVVVAYGQILPQTILDLPRFGCINVHASLLPKYRGAAPIQWAILHDEPETGITIMKMDAGLDTGDILSQKSTPIHPDDTAQSLHDRLARIGADLLMETLPAYTQGRIAPCPQPPETASYARKITKEDGRIQWTDPARLTWNKIRAFLPWPGAYTTMPESRHGGLLKIWKAAWIQGAQGEPGRVLETNRSGLLVACGRDAVRLLELQREGGKRLPAPAFLAGCPLQPGDRLT